MAAWAIPGSANHAAFKKLLNPFFESMEETKVQCNKVPKFWKVSLAFTSPGQDLAGETFAEDATKLGIQTSKRPSPAQGIVLGTASISVCCQFQDCITGVDEDKLRTLLTVKVIFKSYLLSVFAIQDK